MTLNDGKLAGVADDSQLELGGLAINTKQRVSLSQDSFNIFNYGKIPPPPSSHTYFAFSLPSLHFVVCVCFCCDVVDFLSIKTHSRPLEGGGLFETFTPSI